MHVISKSALPPFWTRHPAAKGPLEAWYKLVSSASYTDFDNLRETFSSADYLSPYTVFNIAGNNFRIIAVIHYNRKKLYIRKVLTHREYDDWCKLYRKGKA